MLTAATLFYCLFLFGATHSLFRDSDTGWHLRNGENILTQHALPAADPFSFSKPGQQWFSWEWGSDVVMALANRAAGLTGVVALYATAIAAVSWLWIRFQFAIGGDFLLAGVFAPLMVTVAGAHWLARPHVFSWIFLLGLLIFLETVSMRPIARAHEGTLLSLVGIAGVTALWANFHASFLVAPGFCLLYALGHTLTPIIWETGDATAEYAKSRWFVWLAMAATAGSLVNPYGWRLHQHVISFLLDGRLTAQIAEFQSFNFHDKEGIPFALVVAIAALGAVLALIQKRLTHFLLAATCTWAAIRSARALPLLAILILPIANAAIVRGLREARGLRHSFRRKLDEALAYSARLGRIDGALDGRVFLTVTATVMLLALGAPAFSRTVGFSADSFPVAASEAVTQLPSEARILSSDSYGGYLIFRFAAARKVFFDGRSDFYGADFLEQYGVLIHLKPGWRRLVSRYGFTHALLPSSAPLTSALEHEGWSILHEDSVATLLEAR